MQRMESSSATKKNRLLKHRTILIDFRHLSGVILREEARIKDYVLYDATYDPQKMKLLQNSQG
jgi:hypothetical protein